MVSWSAKCPRVFKGNVPTWATESSPPSWRRRISRSSCASLARDGGRDVVAGHYTDAGHFLRVLSLLDGTPIVSRAMRSAASDTACTRSTRRSRTRPRCGWPRRSWIPGSP